MENTNDDLIYRQAVNKIIDNLLENDNLQASPSVWHGLHMIKQLPSAQPEIIRCKDCKHRDVENGFCEGRGWPMQLVPDDGFCDKGERR